MRKLDRSNRGHLTNDSVYKLMQGKQKLIVHVWCAYDMVTSLTLPPLFVIIIPQRTNGTTTTAIQV